MTFKHPANSRSGRYGDGMFFFTQPVGAPYGDGMFFFTQPVGSPVGEEPSYGDGMFFFTQPVGAPQSIRPGTYGRAPGYGAAKGTDVLKSGAGVRATLTKGGGRAAPAIPAETYTTFEKAAADVGVWQFWVDFWSGNWQNPPASGASSTRSTLPSTRVALSSTSQAQLTDATNRLAAAKSILDKARAPLLKGISSDASAVQRLASYEGYAIAKGWYSQAFRNLSGSKRKKSKLLVDAIVRDIEAAGGETDTNKVIGQTYLLADAQSDFTTNDYASSAQGSNPPKRKGESEKDYQARSASHEYLKDKRKSYAAGLLSSTFLTLLAAHRDRQVKAMAGLVAGLDAAKTAFEKARTDAYASRTLPTVSPTARRGGTTTTTTTTTDTTGTTTDTTGTTTDTTGTDAGVFTPSTTPDAGVTPTLDLTGGPPEGAQTLEGKPEMKEVGITPTTQAAGEETFFSKYKVWIGLGSVVAIGGGYWWYTNKYLPSKNLGR